MSNVTGATPAVKASPGRPALADQRTGSHSAGMSTQARGCGLGHRIRPGGGPDGVVHRGTAPGTPGDRAEELVCLDHLEVS